MGLLSKTLSLADSNKIPFKQFTKKYNISLCAVFSKFDNDFVITDSTGFDGISIISSISSSDFWNGTIKNKNEWQHYNSNEEMLPFFQLFSFNQKDKITGISIRYFENKIFMACSTEKVNFTASEALTKDLLNLSFENNAQLNIEQFNRGKDVTIYKYKYDFSTALNFHIQKSLRKTEYTEIIYETIAKELLNFLEKCFPSPHIVSRTTKNSINIIYCNSSNVPFELLKAHLVKECYALLDDESKFISFTLEGTANSYKELIDFLQAE